MSIVIPADMFDELMSDDDTPNERLAELVRTSRANGFIR